MSPEEPFDLVGKLRELASNPAGAIELAIGLAKEALKHKEEAARLQAELTALRTRAVPAIVWFGNDAESGRFTLQVYRYRSGWTFRICRGPVFIEGGAVFETDDVAKGECETAFLRLVGCGNG